MYIVGTPVFGSPILFNMEGFPESGHMVSGFKAQQQQLPSAQRVAHEERKNRVLWLSKPTGEFEQLLHRSVSYALACAAEDPSCSECPSPCSSSSSCSSSTSEDSCSSGTGVMRVAQRLSVLGFRPLLRKAVGGSEAFCHFSSLRHEFLLIRGERDCAGTEIVVETRLREHFEVTNPSPAYAELLRTLPDVFVGTTPRLLAVVQELCTGMSESFALRGQALPPWRRTKAMMSKWAPSKVHDTVVTPYTTFAGSRASSIGGSRRGSCELYTAESVLGPAPTCSPPSRQGLNIGGAQGEVEESVVGSFELVLPQRECSTKQQAQAFAVPAATPAAAPAAARRKSLLTAGLIPPAGTRAVPIAAPGVPLIVGFSTSQQ